jgi:CBS domain containing-hemolysin-like protein
MSPATGLGAALGAMALFVLLSGIRHAALLLGPVGLRRLFEERPALARVFRGGYHRVPSRVRISLQMATQGALVVSLWGAGAALAFLPPPTRLGLVAGLAVFLIAIAGQVLARGLASLGPERWLTGLLWLTRAVDLALFPIVAPIDRLLQFLAGRYREGDPEDGDEGQEEEIEAFIDVGTEEGLLEEGEGRLIRGVLEFGDRVVREVMTPRTAIVAVEEGATISDLRRIVVQAKHSRLPVYRGTLDEVVGLVTVRDLLEALERLPAEAVISPLIRPAHFVPETKRVADLLRELQRRRSHLAIIVDEYGGTAGLVTIEDLVEEIVGEIQDEHEPEEEALRPDPDGALLVSGGADVERVAEALGVDRPEGEFETVGGFIFTVLGRVPRRGESFVHGDLAVEVIEADRRRIQRARIRRLREVARTPEETTVERGR